MKKRICLLSSLIMALGILCFSVSLLVDNKIYAQPVASNFSMSGSGSPEDPYTISTALDLVNLADRVNNIDYPDSLAGKYVVLANDIDMSSVSNFTPIGWRQGQTFAGNFNGQGYAIKNLTIKNNLVTPNNCNWGLFGVIKASSGAVIKNFSLVNLKIEVSSFSYQNTYYNVFAGGVVGYVELNNLSPTDSIIEAVAVRGSKIQATAYGNANAYAGGVVGSTSMKIGGRDISASNYATNNMIIKYCYNNASVLYSKSNGNGYVGGMVGLGFVDINNCYSLKSPLFPTLIAPSKETLLNVAYSYYTLPSDMGNYNYYYWTTNVHKQVGEAGVLEENAYSMLASSSNPSANKWLLEKTDNPATDGVIILKNVGNTYVEPPVTSVNINAQDRKWDIQSNNWVNIAASSSKSISIGSVYTVNTYEKYNTKYLARINKDYFNIEKSGKESINVNTPSLTITNKIVPDYQDGTIYTNYINGSPIKINGVEYWICFDNTLKLYTLDESTKLFSEVSIDNSNLFPSKAGLYLIGWSTTKTDYIYEYAFRKINKVYWHCDEPLVISILRNGLEGKTNPSGSDFDVSGIDYNINVENFVTDQNNSITLFPVWGDLKFRAYFSVYKYFNNNYHLSDNVTVNTTATKGNGNFFRFEKNQTYNLSTFYNNQLIVLNNGYNAIEWRIGTFTNNTITDFVGAQYGTLTNKNSATATLTNATTETQIIAVLSPRTDIKLSVFSNEFDGSQNLIFKINDGLVTSDTKVIYGETYTITVEEIPKGWYLKSASIENANTRFSVKDNTCTFVVDTNQDELKVTVFVAEGFFTNLICDMFLAVLVVSLAILITSSLVNGYKPVEEYIPISPKKKDDKNNTQE